MTTWYRNESNSHYNTASGFHKEDHISEVEKDEAKRLFALMVEEELRSGKYE